MTCSVDVCDRPRYARGWCQAHYSRWLRNGDQPQGRIRQYLNEGDGYVAVHKRLGNASAHRCADCGEQACDWSYIGGSPDEKVDRRRRSGSGVYTTDLSYYVPRCRDCHMKLDMRGEDNPSAKLTREQVRAIREAYTGAWGQQTALAREYGVIQATISKIVLNKTWLNEIKEK